MAGPKICTACGEDCSDRPRTKDPRGRYYCTACYEERQRTKAAAPDLLADLLEAGDAPSSPCPTCGQPLADDAILCVQCGFSREGAGMLAAPVVVRTRPPGRSTAVTWLFDLFARPGLWFRTWADRPVPILTVCATLLCGLFGAFDRIDTQWATLDPGDTISVPARWLPYWGFAAASGLLAAAGFYAIGGWWYGIRLRLCGAARTDRFLWRRVMVFSTIIVALPAVVMKLADSAIHESPAEAINAALGVTDVLLLLLLLYSIAVSWIGVRTVFDVGMVRSVIFFIALPLVFYVAVFAVIALREEPLVARSIDTAANVNETRSFRSLSMGFQYPGNWVVSRRDPEFDPEANVPVLAVHQDAGLFITLFERDATLGEQLEFSLAYIDDVMGPTVRHATFDRWGSFPGEGVELDVVVDGAPRRAKLFIGEVGDGRHVRVLMVWEQAGADDVLPGFGTIEQTLVFFVRR